MFTISVHVSFAVAPIRDECAMSDIDALNYPYIHVRNVEWLKRTLLIFPHVVRIVPEGRSRLDSEDVLPFIDAIGRRGPLLRPARLYDGHVEKAQRILVTQIERELRHNGSAFRQKFGRDAARLARNPQTPSYQVHEKKVLGDLANLVQQKGLAWRPDQAEADSPEYLEFHPRLGEAIMTTLALAVAENEGLQVVTEFPDLHGHILNQTSETAFGRLAHATEQTQSPITGNEVLNFIVYRRCDPSKLTAEGLLALNDEWGAIGALREELQKEANKKHDRLIKSKHIRENYLNEIVNRVMKNWKSDQANMSNFAKDLFGKGKISQPAELLKKLADKVFTPAAAGSFGGATASTAAPAIVGSLTTGTLMGASAGFAIGLIAFGASTLADRSTHARHSPYRYLTTMHKNGVSFVIGP